MIGGWAAYLWTNLHKSKDVDIVVKGFDGLAALKRKFNLKKNDELRKYEIKMDEIDIDVYVPFFSRLAMPAEDIPEHVAAIQGFEAAKPEALLILKQGAEQDREHSVKGEKDRIDIVALLLYSELNIREYLRLLKKYKLEHFFTRLKSIISGFREIKYKS